MVPLAALMYRNLKGVQTLAHAHSVKRHKGLMDWLTTVDHKKIAILYLLAGGLFFGIGGIEALLIRVQLAKPMNDFVTAQQFNELITMHGTTMIFLGVMPVIFALMNAVIPLQIGARDVAFPFLNALGFWTFLFGGLLLNLSWIMGGAPDAGWTSYTPLSTTTYSLTHGVDFYTIGLQIAGLGTLIGGINFLATIITMRAPGMSYMRMPMFTWTTFVTSAMILFAFPAITVGLVLLTFDRILGANFFNVEAGGNPVLWQHIFWIFGHPEVYILILPAFGVISEVVSTFSRKRLFGYSSMVFATILIAFLGFMVWAHHMFTTGMGPVANALFSIATMLIAVPTGIKIFNWLFTMWGGQITFNTANLFASGFIPTFVMGGVTGVMLASAPADYQYHDTYFVVAHFHYVIVGGLVLGLFSGLHYWWPKMFGRMLNEKLGKWEFWTFIIGFHLTFFVQHFLGLIGMQRRVFTYLPNQGFDLLNLVSTVGAFLMGVGVIIFLINVAISFKQPVGLPNDPWGDGRTLEWSIPSPPPEYNFKQTPLVRGIDAFWKEKVAGHDEMTPAEPVGPIHMPSATILPFLMSVGLFIAGLGFMFTSDDFGNSFLNFIFSKYIVTGIGLAITFGSMLLRSLFDDHGWHIEPEELNDKGVKA
ncbi:cytochrome c oxidase subunit 1 [compost metagenome]